VSVPGGDAQRFRLPFLLPSLAKRAWLAAEQHIFATIPSTLCAAARCALLPRPPLADCRGSGDAAQRADDGGSGGGCARWRGGAACAYRLSALPLYAYPSL